MAKYISPHINSREAHQERVVQVFVAPFSNEQIVDYLKNFAGNGDLNVFKWPVGKFQKALAANADLAGLASSPLMLFMVLTILPSISSTDSKVHTHSTRFAET